MPPREKRNYGRICIFLSRSCGAFSAIIILICGFIALIPFPSQIAGSLGRCIAAGLIIILSSVVMFFLEATVLGYCFDKISFLVTISKYISNWVRFILYLVFSAIPLALWCLSASTIIALGLFFVVAALNFVLAIGMKGDHASTYSRVTLSDLNPLENGRRSEEEGKEDDKDKEGST